MRKSVTRIKICGITQVEDALIAAKLGADAIGFVFYAPSPRAVSSNQAKKICEALPPFITTVGLFVNADLTEVNNVLAEIPLGLLQFHGEETADYCQQFNQPWLKALRVNQHTDINSLVTIYSKAQGILLDSYVSGTHGGTGTTFDWSLIPQDINIPLILAGGLNPTNVKEAIQTVKPYAVDVSGGVELKKGIKDPEKIKAFIKAVQSSL